MLGRFTTVAFAATLSACGHVPNRPMFEFERTGGNGECTWLLAAADDDADAGAEALPERHLLWSRYCDVRAMSDNYFRTAQRASRVVDGKNWITFAGALYAGTTFFLNPRGLSETETTDLRETGVGIAALQLTNQVYNPIQSRDNNLRAFHAYACVAETTRMALERDVYVRAASDIHFIMMDDIDELQALVDGVAKTEGASNASNEIPDEGEETPDSNEDTPDDGEGAPAPLLSEEVSEEAEEAMVTARAELARSGQQVVAYYNFPSDVVRARDSIHGALITAGLRSELSYATLIQSMSTTVAANLAFLNKEEPAPVEPPTEGRGVASEEDSSDDRARRLIRHLNRQVAESQRVTPNIATLTANLGQCTAVMTTGVRPSAPTLSDIGPGELPSQTDPFFPPSRVDPNHARRR